MRLSGFAPTGVGATFRSPALAPPHPKWFDPPGPPLDSVQNCIDPVIPSHLLLSF